MTKCYCLVCETYVDFGYLRNSSNEQQMSRKSLTYKEISSGKLRAEKPLPLELALGRDGPASN
jgi:hypothetical protein